MVRINVTESVEVDLEKIKKVYVIGIKGSGVVALVEILTAMKIEVTGSDTHEKFFTEEVLKKIGIKYFEEFSPKNIPDDVDLIIYSTAYNEENNSEFREAKSRELPMVSYPEMLGLLFNEKYGIAVCGTHGKTTTSAMLAEIMKYAGADPTAVIGSRVRQWGSNALSGKGEYFVIEADEFQNKFRYYDPKAVILTSIDYDHPDYYKNFSEYKQAFFDFVAKIPRAGFLVVWGDSADTNDVACGCQCEIIKYGFMADNDLIAKNHYFQGLHQEFDAWFLDKSLGHFEINLPGKHNVLNALSVISVCHKLRMDMEKVREALKNFQGTSRRFEIVGERNGAILIDDYGHHPEEIKATLKAAREIYPEKNIIAVFHPHSYSRTEALLHDFAQSFDSADQVIVLDIYGSAREESGNVSSEDLVKLINKYNYGKAEYVPTIKEAVEFLKDRVGGNDVVLAIGAGNVNEVAEELREKN